MKRSAIVNSVWRSFTANSSGQIQLIGRLLDNFARGHWKSYLFSSACGGVVASTAGVTAYLIGHLVNGAYAHRSFSALTAVCLAIVATSLVKAAASYCQSIALVRTSSAITAEIQKKMIDVILTNNVAAFSDRHTAAVLNDINTASSSGANILSMLANVVGRDTLSILVLAALIFWQSPWLALVSIIVTPFSILLVRVLNAGAQRAAAEQYEARKRAFEILSEALRGLATIKAFTAETHIRERVHRRIDQVREGANRIAHLTSRSRPLMDIIGSLSMALVFFYGGYGVIVRGESPGTYFTFAASFLLAYAPLKRLTLVRLGMAEAMQGVHVLFDFLESPSTDTKMEIARSLEVKGGEVNIRDVEFAYSVGEPVLRGISFIAEAGKVTAIVGPSGSGKSTLLKLILRLYVPTRGTITIDGQAIATVAEHSLRSQIAYVGQDVFLFSGTIAENIRLGSQDADEAALIAAAKAAAVHDFIVALPSGYDTRAGEGGLRFSSGQRQRISVARALLKNAPIILLDEATASLDSEGDLDVRRAIAELCRGRTTIVVAHRLNTIVEADMIYVMEAGQMVECGTHEEMVERAGRYAALYRSMFETIQVEEPEQSISPQRFLV
jgi:ABC-type multidrug transport system fused ATPase/permease subunit